MYGPGGPGAFPPDGGPGYGGGMFPPVPPGSWGSPGGGFPPQPGPPGGFGPGPMGPYGGPAAPGGMLVSNNYCLNGSIKRFHMCLLISAYDGCVWVMALL